MHNAIAMVEACEVRVDHMDFTPYMHITLRLPLSRDIDIEDGVIPNPDTQAMLLGHAIMEQSRMMLALTKD